MSDRTYELYSSRPSLPSNPQKQELLGSTTDKLVDGFNRSISYLRLSVTDRCDLRCSYCMPERMTFLPKSDVLSFDELELIVGAFVQRGIRKLRITGGEPLVRKGIMDLMGRFAEHLGRGLDELTLTTNGTQLEQYASELKSIGIERINISLDTLDNDRFARLTRRDQFDQVMKGIDAADRSGLKVKINTVALANENADEIPDMIAWAHGRGFDLSLIEIMPLGEDMVGRPEEFLSLETVKSALSERWTLNTVSDNTGGPSRYVRVSETGGRLGFISPLSHNFCSDCNRIRMTCTGRLYACLGHEDGADLKSALRQNNDLSVFNRLVDQALGAKPLRHDFDVDRIEQPSSPRTMSVTGG